MLHFLAVSKGWRPSPIYAVSGPQQQPASRGSIDRAIDVSTVDAFETRQRSLGARGTVARHDVYS